MRYVAGGVGERDLQGAAVSDGRGQGDDEGAIRANGTRREDVACGVTHLHGGAGFATAAQLAASQADYQIGRGFRRRGIHAVNVRCSDRAGHGRVASGIGCSGLQNFAIDLWWREVDAEHAGRADHGRTQFGAIGGQNTHGAAGFGTAGDDATVRADGQFGRGGRRSDIRSGDLRRQRGRAAVIDGDHIQQFAVGLGWAQLDAEGAVGIGDGAADQCAVGVVYFDAAARWRGTSQSSAVGIDGQVARADWCSGQWYIVFDGHRGVAAWVGLYQAQLFALLCSRVEVDQEGTVGTHHARADDVAVGIAHFYGGARFATPAQGRASRADQNVGDGIRRGDVRGGEFQWYRAIARGIDLANVQGFAVGLGRREGEAEGTVSVDQAAADEVAGSIAHLHGGAGFAATGEGYAIRQGQVGWLVWGAGVRVVDVRCRDACSWRSIAGCVRGADFQGLAVGLWRLQGDAELAVSTRYRSAQRYAASAAYGNRRARFGTPGKGGALFVDGEVGRCQWCGCIRGGDGAWCRDITGTIGQGDFKVLAVDLWWVQRHVEAAVGTHGAAADQVACGITDIHRAARFTPAGQAQAIRRHQQVDGRGRGSGIGVRAATAASATAAVGCSCCATDTEQAEPGNRPGRHGATGGADTRDQFVQRGHVFEGKASERCRIVLGVPQGAVFADEDNVAADTGLVHREEVADGDFLTRLQGDDQVLPALGYGGYFVGRYRHLHDAWCFEIDIAPGALSGDFGLLVGDDDVVHGCSLLVSGSPGPKRSGHNRHNRALAGVLRAASTRQSRFGWLGRYSSRAGSNQRLSGLILL